MSEPVVRFDRARPVWPGGRAREMNRFVAFRARCPGPRPRLRVTASSNYRAYLNGKFIGWGPARAAHGYFRVDEWPLVESGELAIEVAG